MTPPAQQLTNGEAVRTGIAGALASVATWYAGNLETINQWLVHVAQLGGLVIMFYSILILRRNWKNGKNSSNPLNNG